LGANSTNLCASSSSDFNRLESFID
jgi:hypothetical protein